jgi:hypothetical protein
MSSEDFPSNDTNMDLSQRAPSEAELEALLRDPSLWMDPSPDLGRRVISAVHGTQETAEVAAAPLIKVDQSHAAPDPTPVIPLRRSSWAQRTGWLAAAASVMLVVGVGLGVGVRRTDSESRNTTEFALVATELEPNARGSVAITPTESGLRIELDAQGLPRRDGRLFYQAWLKGESGLVPIGTFHTGDNVTLWAGVALDDFPTLTITQEEVGDQASSGKKVLAGTKQP